MHSNCPSIVVGELMVPALPASYHAGYINQKYRSPSAFWSYIWDMKAQFL